MWNLADTGGVKTSSPSTMTTQQDEPSDIDLVARARSGDNAAYARQSVSANRVAPGGGDHWFGRRRADIAQEAL
jgi:hypothetical protein